MPTKDAEKFKRIFKVRVYGWLIRIWFRCRWIPLEIVFLLNMTSMEKRTRSDYSLVDEFRFFVWAVCVHCRCLFVAR